MATDSLYSPDWRDAARKDWSRVSALLGLDDVEGAAFFLHMNDLTSESTNGANCQAVRSERASRGTPETPRTLCSHRWNRRSIVPEMNARTLEHPNGRTLFREE